MRAIIILWTFATLLPAGGLYSVTDLGGLGGSTAVAFGINNSGGVAGWAQTSSGDQHAALSLNGSALKDLSPLMNSDTYAYAINASGTIAGTSYQNGQPHGSIWSGSGVTDLGAGIFATGINDAGIVIGGNGHAFQLANGVYRDLGVLPGGDWSSAYGINNAGAIAGYASAGSGVFRGFVWTAAGGMSELGTLGGNNSYAMGINNSGEVVGRASVASGYDHAFLAVEAVMSDLGTLGGGNSYAYGVNDSGNVVGYSSLASGANPHAFLYADGYMQDLNNMLAGASGWELLQAYGINSSGQIVGAGLFNGEARAFRLDPIHVASPQSSISPLVSAPEPGTQSILALGLGSILLLLWRSRVIFDNRRCGAVPLDRAGRPRPALARQP